MHTLRRAAAPAALLVLAAVAPAQPDEQQKAVLFHMRKVVFAVYDYSDEHGHGPANVYGKDGKALLSWRVQILPYLGQSALYEKFKLDEAWDSPANKEASQTAVRAFQMPGRPAPQRWETFYQTFISPKDTAREHRAWLTDGEKKGPRIDAVPDGSSNTFIVVEARDAVPWAKPDDLPYDGKAPLPKLGGPNGTFTAVFGDGHARTFRRVAFDEANLRRAISIDDGMAVIFPRN